ncbi:MAG: hypothetical protein GWN87_16670, partial [Desulfuromonadales bacterium]|nr:hypothetical protein [Desulfuromonadales bacterium]
MSEILDILEKPDVPSDVTAVLEPRRPEAFDYGTLGYSNLARSREEVQRRNSIQIAREAMKLHKQTGIPLPEVTAIVARVGADPLAVGLAFDKKVHDEIWYRQYDGFFHEMAVGLGNWGLRTGSGAAGTLAKVLEPGALAVGAMGISYEPMQVQRALEATAQDLWEQAQLPHWGPSKGGGIKGFLSYNLLPTTGYMAAFMTGIATAGVPGAIGASYIMEGEGWERQALADAADPRIARLGGIAVASINAMVEQMQLNHLMRFARKGIAKEFADAVATRAVDKIKQAGLK